MIVEGEPATARLGEAVEVTWVDAEGRRRVSAGLGALAEVAFEDAAPVREFMSYRQQRYFPGMWWSATTGRHVGYESWLERDHAMLLDFDPEVVGLSSQPFTLAWRAGGESVSHTPDYFARLVDGSVVVVDVRAACRVKSRDAAKFEMTAAVCAAVVDGWSFRLVHELDPVLAANLRWLSGYRHPRHDDLGLGPVLRKVFTGGYELLAGAAAGGDSIRCLPVLFHLLWRGELVTDVSVPMHDGTVIVTRDVA